ncbi:hypothetical protein ACFPN0_00845 [Kitasatospora cinereorecta]
MSAARAGRVSANRRRGSMPEASAARRSPPRAPRTAALANGAITARS